MTLRSAWLNNFTEGRWAGVEEPLDDYTASMKWSLMEVAARFQCASQPDYARFLL